MRNDDESALAQAIAELEEFIVQNINAREARKGLAVKLVYQGYLYMRKSREFLVFHLVQ